MNLLPGTSTLRAGDGDSCTCKHSPCRVGHFATQAASDRALLLGKHRNRDYQKQEGDYMRKVFQNVLHSSTPKYLPDKYPTFSSPQDETKGAVSALTSGRKRYCDIGEKYCAS
jgi:hypothetical protein